MTSRIRASLRIGLFALCAAAAFAFGGDACAQPTRWFNYTGNPNPPGEMLVSMSEDLYQRMMQVGLRRSQLRGPRQPGTIRWEDDGGQGALICKVGRRGGGDAFVGRHENPFTRQVEARQLYMICDRTVPLRDLNGRWMASPDPVGNTVITVTQSGGSFRSQDNRGVTTQGTINGNDLTLQITLIPGQRPPYPSFKGYVESVRPDGKADILNWGIGRWVRLP